MLSMQQIQVLLFETLGYCFPNVFDPRLVEFMDAKPADMED